MQSLPLETPTAVSYGLVYVIVKQVMADSQYKRSFNGPVHIKRQHIYFYIPFMFRSEVPDPTRLELLSVVTSQTGCPACAPN